MKMMVTGADLDKVITEINTKFAELDKQIKDLQAKVNTPAPKTTKTTKNT